MPYVRQRGNQLALVHGLRQPDSGKVEQRILFTIYSRPEAEELLADPGRRRFRSLMSDRYPGIRFDWKKIDAAIRERLDALPETYDYRPVRLRRSFREDLCAFTRQIVLADPQVLISSAELIAEHRHQLWFLQDLIDWRLELCDQEENEWNADDAYFWRFALAPRVPVDAEEMASDLYEKGRLDEAEAAFRLLVDCFENYAEGHNYLGLIALDRNDLEAAIEHFEKTVEIGRRLFPRRRARWVDLDARPYIRGQRNLALSLNRAGRHDDALAVCDVLEKECDDPITAGSFRATVYLNTTRFEEARDTARRLVELHPDEDFVAGLASFELGEHEEAAAELLHASLNHPRAARMLANLPSQSEPASYEEARDHNAGVHLVRSLGGYLSRRPTRWRTFLRGILEHPGVVALLDEKEDVSRRRREERPSSDRELYDRMQELNSVAFARAQAKALMLTGPARKGRAN